MTIISGKTVKEGPESKLLMNFIESDLLPPLKPEEKMFAFIEPMLSGKRPDLVVVYWDDAISQKWSGQRPDLAQLELRLAHHLYLNGPQTIKELNKKFPRNLKRSITNLETAQFIEKSEERWKIAELESIFVIRRIVTFEAKISAISKAIEQAIFNTWFASESYVLTHYKNLRKKTIDNAKLNGIGLWLFGGPNDKVPFTEARTNTIPASYGSWVFNDIIFQFVTKGTYSC